MAVRRMRWVAFGLSLLTLAGCSFASAAVKSQIDGRCKGIGLKGCPEIAEGIITYADGKEGEGEQKLRAGASQNSREEMQQLATLLEPIVAAADEDMAKKLRAVLEILKGEGKPPEGPRIVIRNPTHAVAARSAPPEPKAEEAPPGVMETRSELDALRAGTVNPTTENQLLPCDTTMADAKTCGRARVLLGPFVLTNLYAAGGCNRDLFVTSADSKVYWTMLVPAGEKMNVTGRFPIEEGQTLYIGARGNAPTKDELRCAVVWSGFRPSDRMPTRTP